MGSDASGALALEGEVIRDFDRMYRENATYVLRLLRRFGLSRQEAEDVSHDVFEELFLKLLSLDRADRRSLPFARGFLFRLAWGRFANYRRRRSVRSETLAASPPEVLVGPDALEYVLAREMAALLAALPPRDVAVFVGFEVFGNTVPELARELAMSDYDVRTTLRVARARLHAVLTPHANPREEDL